MLLGTPAAADEAVTIRAFGDPGDTIYGTTAWGGDLDADGKPDLLAATSPAGLVRAYSGATGAAIRDFNGTNHPGIFGRSIAFSPDANGDGVDDVIVGAPGFGSSLPPAGVVFLLSGATGAEIARGSGQFNQSRFGSQVVSLGDVTGDGVPDFAAGGPGSTNAFPGEVRAFSGADGSPIPQLSRQGTGTESFGAHLVAPGDLNGDGVPDLIVAAPGAFPRPGAIPLGRVDVLSGKDGTTLKSLRGRIGLLGYALADAGDVDGDGRHDLAVGGEDFTRIVIYSTRTWRPIRKIARPEEGTHFGRFMSAAGDLDGDGRPDLLATIQIGGVEILHAFGTASFGRASIARIDAGTTGYADGAAFVPDEDGDGIPDALVAYQDRAVRVLHVEPTPLPAYTFTAALTRPQSVAALEARGTFTVKVGKTTQDVVVNCKGLTAGGTYTVLLEDGPGSANFDAIGTLALKGGTGGLTVTGTGAPPATLGITSIAQLTGRRVRLRDGADAVILDALLPLPGPSPSSSGKLPLLRNPATTFTAASGTVSFRYTAKTGGLLFGLAVKGVPASTALSLEIEDAPGSGVFVDAGPLVLGKYVRNTGKGELLPGGGGTYGQISGRAIRVVAGAETVLAGLLP
jgi:hypothetical protein